jgi:hypothetical protein
MTEEVANQKKIPKFNTKRRHPNRARKNQKYYFTDETQAAIIEYIVSEDPKEKERLYTTKIHTPFCEICKNLIVVYKFAEPEEMDEVIADCTSLLWEIIDRFDPSKGHRAFAFFTVVARNFLVTRKKNLRKHQSRNQYCDIGNPFEEDSGLSLSDISKISDYQVYETPEETLIKEQFSDSVMDLWDVMEEELDFTENLTSLETSVIAACREICDQIEVLDLTTKMAMRTYIEEYTGLSRKEVNQTLKNLKEVYLSSKAFVPELEEFWSL